MATRARDALERAAAVLRDTDAAATESKSRRDPAAANKAGVPVLRQAQKRESVASAASEEERERPHGICDCFRSWSSRTQRRRKHGHRVDGLSAHVA